MAPSRSGVDWKRVLWSQFVAHGEQQAHRRRSFIYTPHHAAQSLYLLQAGQVSLQLLSSSGRVLTLKVVEAGDLFGLSVFAGSVTYDTFAEALKATRVLVVPRTAVVQTLAQQPHIGLVMIEALGQHQANVSRRLDELAFKSVPARLASLLLDMAEVTDNDQREQSRLPRRTHQQLAEMINAYRETVTKVINQFQAARLLDIDQSGITLLNHTRLREVAQD